MALRETVSFVFPRVFMFPDTKSRGNIKTPGKTKLTSFPRDLMYGPVSDITSVYIKYYYFLFTNNTRHLIAGEFF